MKIYKMDIGSKAFLKILQKFSPKNCNEWRRLVVQLTALVCPAQSCTGVTASRRARSRSRISACRGQSCIWATGRPTGAGRWMRKFPAAPGRPSRNHRRTMLPRPVTNPTIRRRNWMEQGNRRRRRPCTAPSPPSWPTWRGKFGGTFWGVLEGKI